MAKKDIIKYRKSGENTWEISDIAVHSKRCAGKGTKMVNDAIEDIKSQGGTRLFALTRESNAVAKRFYASLSMRAVGLYDFYDEENGVMYFKKI